MKSPFTVTFELRDTEPPGLAISRSVVDPPPKRIASLEPTSVVVPEPVIVPTIVAHRETASVSPPSTVSVAALSTVRSRQLTVPAPEVDGAFGVPAGMTALIEELGTPALQLPESLQVELVAPVQVVD
jgi:hypothetical protein